MYADSPNVGLSAAVISSCSSNHCSNCRPPPVAGAVAGAALAVAGGASFLNRFKTPIQLLSSV